MSESNNVRQAWMQPFQIKENLSMKPIDVKRLLGIEHVEVQEAILFLNKCKQYGADPFMNDMHMIKYSATAKPAIVTGIGFFQKKAAANPRFEGFSKTLWLTEKGNWVPCWIPSRHGKNPLACQASCFIKGYQEKQTFCVNWEENFKNTKPWKEMPSRMLEKNAMVGLLRACLPGDLGGLYMSEEITGEEAPTATVAPASIKLETVSEDLRDPQGGRVFEAAGSSSEYMTDDQLDKKVGELNNEPIVSTERQEIDEAIKKKAEVKKEEMEHQEDALRYAAQGVSQAAPERSRIEINNNGIEIDGVGGPDGVNWTARTDPTKEMPSFTDYEPEQDSRPIDEDGVENIPN